jgi:hypothetical protein
MRTIVIGLALCFMCGCGNLGSTGGHRGQFIVTLTSLSPSSVVAGGPPFTLTVTGSNFLGGPATLVWNGGQQIASIDNSSSTTQAVFPIDAGLIANPGNASIAIVDGINGNQLSNPLTLTITSRTTTACALFGTYHYLATGFDNKGPMVEAGAFAVDATGSVTGEYGFGDTVNPFNFLGSPAAGYTGISGQCTNGATANQGTLSLSVSQNSGTIKFAYTFIQEKDGGGRLVESNDSVEGSGNLSGSGSFAQVVPDSALAGNYAFAMTGGDPHGDGGVGTHISAVGAFTFNGGTLNGASDINDGGTVISNASLSGPPPNNPPYPPFSIDTYSVGQLPVTVNGLQGNFYLYLLVTSPSSGFVITEMPSPVLPGGTPGGAILGGSFSSQTSGSPYNNASLNAPFVFATLGAPPPVCCTTSTDTTIGLASAFNSGAGTFNLQFDNVSAGVASLNQAVTGATYSVASNGRATVSYSVGGNQVDYVYYLDGPNDGYILGLGKTADIGFFHPQSGGPFSTASIDGTFASSTIFPQTTASPNLAAEIALNNGSLSANTPGGALSGSYSVASSGRGTATVNLPLLGGTDLLFYVIGSDTVVVMGSDNTVSDGLIFMHL